MASQQFLKILQSSAQIDTDDQTELLTFAKRSRNRGGKQLIGIISSLFLLSGCSGLGNPFSSGAGGQSGGDLNLPQSIPEPYSKFIESPTKVLACGIDPVQSKTPGEFVITGWGVINAMKGETPLGFVLELTQNGKKYYSSSELTERPDIMKKFNNPLLKYSGFTSVITIGSGTQPVTVRSLLAFDGKFFPCEFTSTIL